MPKPVCIRCQRFFKPKKVGVYVAENRPRQNGAALGTAEESAWVDYKIWAGDLYRCGGCGTEVIYGFAANPVSEHYKPDFGDWKAAVSVSVNDC